MLILFHHSKIGAAADSPGPVDPHLEGSPPLYLSEYNLFRGDGSAQTPNDGVVPYDLNSPLFSDYANKHRFVWMPEGTHATYSEDDVFAFPVGTILIKTFSYLHDLRDPAAGETLIETRLLIHKESGWVGYPYMWNEEQTEARLKIAGATKDFEWTHVDGTKRSVNYIVPNMNQCKGCHENADVLLPIGPKARNLNKFFDYDHGKENQLERWSKVGYLEGAPNASDAPFLPPWDDEAHSIDKRARAWLEINCAHCHNPDGPANTTGLDLRAAQQDPTKIGIFKTPVAAGRGAGDRLYDIVPGKPDESILVYRLESREPGIMMPELPLRLVDEEGLELIRQWIDQMTPREARLRP